MIFIKYYYNILRNKYNNVSHYDLINALKSVFPKLVSNMTYDEFYERHGGIQAYRYYPENVSMFDVLVNTLVNEYKLSEDLLFMIFDNYFKEQDDKLLKGINAMLAECMPYWQSGSPILQQAQHELPFVKQEYSKRISTAFSGSFISVYLSMALRGENILRSQYYEIIKKYFNNEIYDLTNRLKSKYPQNTEYIALEILMQILIQDFGYKKPIK